MQAIVYHRYGAPDVLEISDIPKPTPGPGEVLIRVHAASVNPYDWHFVRATPKFIRIFTGLRGPKSPRLGADVAGEVESVGPAVTGLQPGDFVFGVAQGSFAQFACAAQSKLARIPPGVTFAQAAALPIAAVTALQGLRDCGRLQPGQSVLINGAAGGVGTFAIQIAKHFGAGVAGVCSTRNLDLLRSIGADLAIDYTREDFTQQSSRYDVLFDLVGNRPLSAMRRILKPRGTFIGCGGGGPDTPSGPLLASMLGRMILAPFASHRLTGVFAKINTRDLQELAGLVTAGKLTPVLDRDFPLAATADALRYVEQCHARGKVIVTIV